MLYRLEVDGVGLSDEADATRQTSEAWLHKLLPLGDFGAVAYPSHNNIRHFIILVFT